MVPAPMMATRSTVARLGAFGNAGDLGGLALGEEGVTLRLRLVARHQLEKTFALLLQPFVERQVDRGADGVGRGKRRFQPARLLGQGGDRIGEDRTIGLGGRELASRRRAACAAGASRPPPCGQRLRRRRPDLRRSPRSGRS